MWRRLPISNHVNAVMETLSRKERERLSRRRAMLDAAIEVFAEKGYESASIEEVALRAEFGKGTLYLYFPKGKEAMLEAILKDLANEEYALVEQVLERAKMQNRSFQQTFRALIQAYLNHYDHKKDHFRLVIKVLNRLMLSDESALKELALSLKAKTIFLFASFLDAAMRKGEIRNFQPEALTHIIFGNLHGYIMYDVVVHHTTNKGDPQLKSSLADAQEWLSSLLLHGICTETTNKATTRPL